MGQIKIEIMLKKYSFYLALVFMVSSCSQYKTINYKYTDIDSNRINKLSLKVPKGFIRNDISTIEGEEIRLIYPDSSVIFVSNNFLSGSISNKQNRLEKGIDVIFKEKYNDTLVFKGSTKKGLLWEEHFLNNVVIGFLNVTENKEKEYNRVFSQIQIKQR